MLMSDRQEQELVSTVKHLAGELARLSERVEDLEDGRELDAAIRRNGVGSGEATGTDERGDCAGG